MIDELTGLPALPEGDWWEVRKRIETGYGGIDFTTYTYYNGYEVVWMTPNTSGTKSVYKRKHWYSLFKSWHYIPSDEPIVYGSEKIYKSDPITGYSIAKELTPELILKHAKRLKDRKTDEIMTKSLLGKYPPKKLP